MTEASSSSTMISSPGADPQTQDNVAAVSEQQEQQSIPKRDDDNEELDDKNPAAMSKDDNSDNNNNNDKKPAILQEHAGIKIRYYAIRKCDSLKAPAIFLSWDDCQFYVQETENDIETPQYEEFETLQGANNYILSTSTMENSIRMTSATSLHRTSKPSTPPLAASTITTKKRSALSASLDDDSATSDDPSSNSKKKAPTLALEASRASLPDLSITAIPTAPSAIAAPASFIPYYAMPPATPMMWGAYHPNNYFHPNYFNPAVPTPQGTTHQQKKKETPTTNIAQAASSLPASTNPAVHVANTPQETQQQTKKKAPTLIAQVASLPESASDPKKKKAPTTSTAQAVSLPASTTPPAAVARTFFPYATTPTAAVPYKYTYPDTNYFNPAVHVPKYPTNQKQFQEYATCWSIMVHLLQTYKDKHGHCDVPWKNKNNPGLMVDLEMEPLGSWVKKTRQHIKKFQTDPSTTFLTREHVQQLLDMGFVVDVKRKRIRPSKKRKVAASSGEGADINEGNEGVVTTTVASLGTQKRTQAFEDTFEEMFIKLQEYKAIYGHCNVQTQSKRLADFIPLGRWVYRMRAKIKRFEDPCHTKAVWHLTQTHIQRLTDIGFHKTSTKRKGTPVTTIQEEGKEFEEFLELLQTTIKTNTAIKDVLNLQYWIGKQRVEYEKFNEGQPSRMTAERLVRLAGAGFTFKAKQKMLWEDRATQWRDHKAQNAGADPKRNSLDGLGKWCTDQRVKYHKFQKGEPSNLTEEKIQKLTEWGFHWEYKLKRATNPEPVRPWNYRLGQLKEFKEEHGHCLVPQHFPALGNWVHTQRMDYRKFVKGQKTAMSKERLHQLNEIGFRFYTGKGGGKRMSTSSEASVGHQRLTHNTGTPKAAAKQKQPLEEASESSDDDDDHDDDDDDEAFEVQERTQTHHHHQQQQHNRVNTPQQVQVVAQNQNLLANNRQQQQQQQQQHTFSPWDRYNLGRH